MNRREFIQRAVAAISAVFVSGVAVAKSSPISGFYEAIQNAAISPKDDGDYIYVVHPKTWGDFVSIHRREQWTDAHRAWRKAGKPAPETAQSIWDRYGETFDPRAMAASGEIGRFEGVRFIESRSVP